VSLGSESPIILLYNRRVALGIEVLALTSRKNSTLASSYFINNRTFISGSSFRGLHLLTLTQNVLKLLRNTDTTIDNYSIREKQNRITGKTLGKRNWDVFMLVIPDKS